MCHSFILGFQIKFISSLKLSNVPSEFNTFFNDSLSGHMENDTLFVFLPIESKELMVPHFTC